MNAIELLSEDHDKLDELFEIVKANEVGDHVAIFKKI